MKKLTSKLALVLMLVVTIFSVSGCFGGNYKVSHFINEEEAKKRQFTFTESKEEGSNTYLTSDFKVFVTFKNGQFYSAYIANGTSLQLSAQGDVVYITDPLHTYYYSSNQCLINNEAYDIKSDSCKQSVTNPTDYGKFIKQNFTQIIK